MNVVLIGLCCMIDLMFAERMLLKGKAYVRIGCEQNIKLWTIRAVNGMLGLMIYLTFFPGKFIWEKQYMSKLVYVSLLLALFLVIEMISPSRQLLFFFRKAPNEEDGQLYEIEESYDRFYQFVTEIMLLLMINLALIKLLNLYLVHKNYGLNQESLISLEQCLVYVMGVLLLLFSCISFRQMITQLCLVKKGYFRQDIFQTLRKKDEIQERLSATHKKL